MGWKAIVHSAIGTRHQQRQLPCQDYGQFLIQESGVIGAVADGAGSARRSDVGAQLAVKAALDSLKTWLDANESRDLSQLEADLTERFTTVVETVITTLKDEALAADHPLQELGCTLLAFIATPQWMAAMQIGDGFIVVQAAETAPYELLFAPSKGEFINETVFVTTPGALNYLQCKIVPGEPAFICAATDGLEKVAIRFQDWHPYPPFFNPFKACLQTIDDAQERQAYLETFLHSDRLNARTDDDKTLLACSRETMSPVIEPVEASA